MKKFIIYGKKNNLEGILATIYMKNNKVVIESSDKVVKEVLETEINKAIEDGGDGFTMQETIRVDDSRYAVDHFHTSRFVRISDKDFIEAIRANSLAQNVGSYKSGEIRYGFCTKLRKLGYKIDVQKSRIVEE